MNRFLDCTWHWLLPAVLALTALEAVAQATTRGKWGADYFPNVVLTTHEGRQVRFYEDLVKGRSVAINVIYTRCADECPLETARMAEVQRLLGARVGKDIFFYSISIDPEHDSPQVLNAYAGKFGVGPGWLFLTGKKEDIKLLTRKLGLSRRSDFFSKDGHASSLMLGHEAEGQWMRTSAVDNPRFLATTMANFFRWPDPLPTQGYERATVIDIGKSEFLFQSRCAACHTIGAGDRIGPDLMNVTQRRDRAWLARYLKEPDRVRSEGDPTAADLARRYRQVPMPNLSLGDDDVAGLIAWIERRSTAASNSPSGTEGAVPRLRPGR